MKRPNKPPPSAFIPFFDGDLDPPALHEVDEGPVQPNGTAVFEHPIMYHWIHDELNLPEGGETKKVNIVGQSKYNNGNIIDKYDRNPMLNTMVYDVEFPDGTICKYRANVIADNMYSQVDYEGFLHSILSGILDLAKDSASVQKGDQYIIINSGQRCMQKINCWMELTYSLEISHQKMYTYISYEII